IEVHPACECTSWKRPEVREETRAVGSFGLLPILGHIRPPDQSGNRRLLDFRPSIVPLRHANAAGLTVESPSVSLPLIHLISRIGALRLNVFKARHQFLVI